MIKKENGSCTHESNRIFDREYERDKRQAPGKGRKQESQHYCAAVYFLKGQRDRKDGAYEQT